MLELLQKLQEKKIIMRIDYDGDNRYTGTIVGFDKDCVKFKPNTKLYLEDELIEELIYIRMSKINGIVVWDQEQLNRLNNKIKKEIK